jgi:gliding motility-associated protein GldM
MAPNKSAPGFAVWPAMEKYRTEICDLIVEAASAIDEDGKKFSFKDPKIKKFKDLADLDKQLKKALDASNINQDDRGIIASLYKGLTKNEMQADPHEEGKTRHWIGGTFDHAPSVAAIAALSSLQSEVLTARADAMAYLASKVGGGNYAFNKVTSLAIAAPSVSGGATDTLRVMMAAFDSEKQPIVVPDAGKGTLVETKGGQAYIAYTAPSGGEMELTGTISIKDKFGNLKPASYSTVVKVVEKGGSIALPEVSVFYTDWPNKVTYSAAGVVSTSVSCSGCSKSTKNKSWKDADGISYKGDWLYVNRGTRSVTVTLQGKDNNGNNVTFGKYKYPVKKFPKPEVKTKQLAKSRGGFLDVGLGDAFNFKGIKYKVTGGEILGKGFSGDRIKPANLTKARPGQKIGIVLFTKRTDTGKKDIIDGVIEIK